jgi:16S rRNA (adenine1518-N6/adenine1519-N6)-dimethyltransferase
MPKNSNLAVEIGPGLGDLTKFLVKVKSVEAFEVDTDLCKHLQGEFKAELQEGRLKLHCGDVLDRWGKSLCGADYDLVANLPYYIATPIVLKALKDPHCQNILVMVQYEVAQKFCASSGEKSFSALSVIAQSVAETKIIQKVPPSAFDPAPKVDSAVMLLQKFANRADDGFEKFLKTAFVQPRKTLAKNLLATFEKGCIAESLKALNLPQSIRPHQLTTDDYHQLYTLLAK